MNVFEPSRGSAARTAAPPAARRRGPVQLVRGRREPDRRVPLAVSARATGTASTARPARRCRRGCASSGAVRRVACLERASSRAATRAARRPRRYVDNWGSASVLRRRHVAVGECGPIENKRDHSTPERARPAYSFGRLRRASSSRAAAAALPAHDLGGTKFADSVGDLASSRAIGSTPPRGRGTELPAQCTTCSARGQRNAPQAHRAVRRDRVIRGPSGPARRRPSPDVSWRGSPRRERRPSTPSARRAGTGSACRAVVDERAVERRSSAARPTRRC